MVNPDALACLTISASKVAALSPLYNSSFRSLTQLNLSFNRIADISHLSHLRALRTLDVSHNRIVALEALAKMDKLVVLRANNNAVEALDPLSGLKNIQELWLSDNKIDWLEFVYLLPLINLNHLIKANNPCDAKSRVDHFIWAICASLVTLDGADAYTSLSSSSSTPLLLTLEELQNLQPPSAHQLEAIAGRGSDFLRSTDGRVMFAQAKSHLPPSLRLLLQPFVDRLGLNHGHEQAAVPPHMLRGKGSHNNHQHHQHSNNSNGGLSAGLFGSQDDSSVGSLGSHGSGGSGGSDGRGRRRKGQGGGGGGRGRGVVPTKHKVKHFKAERRAGPGGLPRKFLPDAPLDAFAMQQQEGGEEQGRELMLPSISSPSAPASSSSSSPQTQTQATVIDAAAHAISSLPPTISVPAAKAWQGPSAGDQGQGVWRFGADDSAPVALALQAGGNGYARWSKNGSVACSFENGRVFCSYKGGSIAVVLDKEGNGSVMDPRGKCVLLLQEVGTARILDRAGNLVGEERRGTGAGAEAGAGAAEGASQEGAKVFKWAFDGLHVEFKPTSWELCVRLQNDRVACEFSSLSGGRLIKDRGAGAATFSALGVGGSVGAGVAGAGAGARGRGVVPDLDGMHDEMRQGIASVSSGLDSMMAGLKSKGGGNGLDPSKAQGNKGRGKKDKSKR